VRGSVALAVMLALLVPAADARAQVGARPVQAPAAGDLFVLTAAEGELERMRGRNRLFRLVLRRPAHDVTGFTDRPARRTGQQPLARFVRSWASLGFAAVPPNAAVILSDAPSNRDTLIVELSRPRLGAGGRTLAFRAEVLRGNPRGRLRGFARRADRRVAARFGRVSLFIDPAGREVDLLLTLSNIPPQGGFVSISFSNAQIDLTENELLVNADGATSLHVAPPTAFGLTAIGTSPLNGSVEIAINLLARSGGCDGVGGVALLSAGASAALRVLRQTVPITNGPFCIRIS
jgi:hypothetical protein